MGKFELTLRNRDIKPEEILADVLETCAKLKVSSITRVTYDLHGKYGTTSVIRRFGTWNKMLEAAGLNLNGRQNVPDDELFENIANVWTSLGKQPVYREMDKSKGLSKFSVATYEKRFGAWYNALKLFIKYVNARDSDTVLAGGDALLESRAVSTKRGVRTINWRLRAMILIKDNCICKMCGASPAKDPSVILHVDHIHPWSKGGETLPENLQTLCAKCNIGKSDVIF